MLGIESSSNWVATRAECPVELLFDGLTQIVERDVAEVNKLPSGLRGGCIFSVKKNGECPAPLLGVYRRPEGDGGGGALIARFQRGRSAIRITASGMDSVVAIPRWTSDDARCLLVVDGIEYQVWELSRSILEPLFFGDLDAGLGISM